MKHLFQKNIVLTLSLLLFLSFTPVIHADEAPLRLILQWSPQAQFAGYYVALEKGLYRKNGIDVEIIEGGPDRDPTTYLLEDKADFASMFLTGALAECDAGTPLVHLCQIVNRSNLMLIAWKRDHIDKVQDLNGKRVSIWLGGFKPGYLAFFQATGIQPELTPQYYSINLFLHRGVVACAAMEYNEYHALYQSGIDYEEVTTFRLRDYGFACPEDGIYCLRKQYQKNPEACRALAKAALEGWHYAAEHPEETLDIVMQHVRRARIATNRPHMRWMLKTILPTILPPQENEWLPGELSLEDYNACVRQMKQYGVIQDAQTFESFRGNTENTYE